MADFRRWFTVLAVLALMAGAASAQVGIATHGGSATSSLVCVANAAGTPALRPESYTDLVGDIVISCTGGADLLVGSQIPTVNIVVYMTPAVPITSRLLASSGGASEALLIIDDPGLSNEGVVPGFGPQAPQSLCGAAAQQVPIPNTCTAYVGTATGNDSAGDPITYQVAVTGPDSTTAAQNIYQGTLNVAGPNTVGFYNVPVLPPATSGVSRTYRITNIRIPSASVSGGISAQVGAYISTSPSQALPLSQTLLSVGIIGPASTSAVATPATLTQCAAPGGTAVLADTISFTEGFQTAFKTRVVPGGSLNGTAAAATGNTTYAAEATNTGLAGVPAQNIPGGQYGGFSANSESGFIFNQLSLPVSGGNPYYAGLADFGTRLKAVFTNVPSGLTLYVSTSSIPSKSFPNAPAIVGGTSTLPYAVLVDVNGAEPSDTPFAPLTSASIYAVSIPSSGNPYAIWEVTNANPSGIDTLTFGIYVAYAYGAATASNPYGTPITGLPLNAPVPNVYLSFAPEPSENIFTSSTGPTALSYPIPRFVVYAPSSGQYVVINLCQTTLLYPFVTAVSGFDTGIAVANTSVDPFKTVAQTGSCTLYGYGVNVSSTGAYTAAQPVIQGCDAIANPLPGTNCFGGPGNPPVNFIPAGQVGTIDAMSTILAGFQGYVIAVCNFQYAHGYAAVTDVGVRNLWSSYLALELSPVGVGSPRNNVQGIETLAH